VNIARRPGSDSSHVTAPYKLSFYYFIINTGTMGSVSAALGLPMASARSDREIGYE